VLKVTDFRESFVILFERLWRWSFLSTFFVLDFTRRMFLLEVSKS
jgi:hypothetical protein